MRKNIKNDKVIRAITIGIAAVLATTSMPVQAFADELSDENNGEGEGFTSNPEAGDTSDENIINEETSEAVEADVQSAETSVEEIAEVSSPVVEGSEEAYNVYDVNGSDDGGVITPGIDLNDQELAKELEDALAASADLTTELTAPESTDSDQESAPTDTFISDMSESVVSAIDTINTADKDIKVIEEAYEEAAKIAEEQELDEKKEAALSDENKEEVKALNGFIVDAVQANEDYNKAAEEASEIEDEYNEAADEYNAKVEELNGKTEELEQIVEKAEEDSKDYMEADTLTQEEYEEFDAIVEEANSNFNEKVEEYNTAKQNYEDAEEAYNSLLALRDSYEAAKEKMEAASLTYDTNKESYDENDKNYAAAKADYDAAKQAYDAAYNNFMTKYANSTLISNELDSANEKLQAASDKLATAENVLSTLGDKAEEAAKAVDNLVLEAAKKIINAQNTAENDWKVARDNKNTAWPSTDKLFIAYMQNYYVPEVLEKDGKATNINVTRVAGFENKFNYFKVTYKNKEGKQITTAYDYSLGGKDTYVVDGNNMIILEVLPEEVLAVQAVKEVAKENNKSHTYYKDANVYTTTYNSQATIVVADKNNKLLGLYTEDGTYISAPLDSRLETFDNQLFLINKTNVTEAFPVEGESVKSDDGNYMQEAKEVIDNAELTKEEKYKIDEDGNLVVSKKCEATIVSYHKDTLKSENFVAVDEEDAQKKVSSVSLEEKGSEDKIVKDAEGNEVEAKAVKVADLEVQSYTYTATIFTSEFASKVRVEEINDGLTKGSTYDNNKYVVDVEQKENGRYSISYAVIETYEVKKEEANLPTSKFLKEQGLYGSTQGSGNNDNTAYVTALNKYFESPENAKKCGYLYISSITTTGNSKIKITGIKLKTEEVSVTVTGTVDVANATVDNNNLQERAAAELMEKHGIKAKDAIGSEGPSETVSIWRAEKEYWKKIENSELKEKIGKDLIEGSIIYTSEIGVASKAMSPNSTIITDENDEEYKKFLKRELVNNYNTLVEKVKDANDAVSTAKAEVDDIQKEIDELKKRLNLSLDESEELAAAPEWNLEKAEAELKGLEELKEAKLADLDDLRTRLQSLTDKRDEVKEQLEEANKPAPSPDTTPETNPEENPGANPETTPETNPGTTPEINPGTTPGTTPGTNPGATPGINPGTTPGTTPGTVPGTTPDTTPGTTPNIPGTVIITPDTPADTTPADTTPVAPAPGTPADTTPAPAPTTPAAPAATEDDAASTTTDGGTEDTTSADETPADPADVLPGVIPGVIPGTVPADTIPAIPAAPAVTAPVADTTAPVTSTAPAADTTVADATAADATTPATGVAGARVDNPATATTGTTATGSTSSTTRPSGVAGARVDRPAAATEKASGVLGARVENPNANAETGKEKEYHIIGDDSFPRDEEEIEAAGEGTVKAEEVVQAEEIVANDEVVTIEDEEVPLAENPFAEESTENGVKPSWWWLLIILLLGEAGRELYKKHKEKVEAKQKID